MIGFGRRTPGNTAAPVRRMGPLTVIVAAAISLAGCGISPESEPTALEVESGQPLEFPVDTASDESIDAEVSIYLVRDEQLRLATREADPGSAARAALEALMAGPTEDEAETGLASAIPSSTTLVGLTIGDRQALVDVSDEFITVGGASEILAVGQIVLTLTQSGEVDAVAFAVEGVATVVPTSQGALTDQPVGADDYRDLIEG